MAVLDTLTGLSIWQSASFAIAGFLTYSVVVAVYRLKLHPLAKYPGPFMSKISYWPTVFSTASGDRHLEQYREHETYGKFVRIAPNVLSINSTSALRQIYGPGKVNTKKGWWYNVFPAVSNEWTTHSTIDVPYHAYRRRIMSYAFSDKAIRDSEEFILENLRKWTKLVSAPKPAEKDDGWSEKKNMASWATYLGFDIMGDLAFGRSFDCVGSEANRWIPDLILGATGFVYVVGYLPFFSLIKPILGSKFMEKYGGKMASDNVKLNHITWKLMDERMEKEKESKKTAGSERKDIAHYLIKSRDPETGKGYTTDELRAESGLIVVAGSDTTSTTIAAAFFYLARFPKVMARLNKELTSTFADVEEIRTGKKLSSLPYLRAVMDETLRMASAAPGILPREVMDGGIEVDGQHIPTGTQVGSSIYCIHRSEEYYPDAFTFRPERWIVDHDTGVTEEDVEKAHSAFCAFSLGSRGCIGKNLAYAELSLVLARVVYEFEIREAEGEKIGEGKPQLAYGRRRKNEFQIEDRFVASRDGPMIELKARASAAA